VDNIERCAVPFLRWAGGKRWLVKDHSNVFPKQYGRYIEPFLGSGAVFFHLQPAKAILGDSNAELIDTYRAVREHARGLRTSLLHHQKLHTLSSDHYYNIRALSPHTLVERASRTIYLNRTCFNGIYRVNQSGEFNVPKGNRDSVIKFTDDFAALSKLLANADLRVSDFEPLIDEAKKGDLIFADPPYTIRHNLNGFVKYNEVMFSWRDQERLAAALRRASVRGAKIVATNANHSSIRQLYPTSKFKLVSRKRPSLISANSTSRGRFNELIITSNI